MSHNLPNFNTTIFGIFNKNIPMPNQLFYGDNLEILRNYIERDSIDLCYIDPPFNSKRNYNQIYNNLGKEDKAQAQAFIDTWEWDTIAEDGFNQIMSNTTKVFTKQNIELILGLSKVLGKGSLLAYLVSMTLRIAEIYRVLKPTGSFYFHCDPSASHYLKIVIDSIFLPKGGEYQNELIWCYKERELSKRHWNKKHDVIFFYTKTEDSHVFNYNDVLEDYTPVTRAKFKYKDETGLYQIRGKGTQGSPVFKADGLRPEHEEKYPGLTYRQYIQEGTLPRDWLLIPIINKAAKERLGYPTQKPEKLIEKIIKASSNESDVVLDAYCGCGTTVAVAQRLNRKWIGIDITYQSISLILKRLEDSVSKNDVSNIFDNIILNGVPKDMESAIALANKKDDRVRKEFEKWAILTYSNNKALINEKKGADHGIDGIAYIMDGIDSFKSALFSVKSGHSSLSQFREFCHVVTRDNAAIGIFLTLDEPTKQMKSEAVKMGMFKNELTGQEFEKVSIVTINEILAGERLNIPTSIEVLKSAEIKKNKNQTKFDF